MLKHRENPYGDHAGGACGAEAGGVWCWGSTPAGPLSRAHLEALGHALSDAECNAVFARFKEGGRP